jgi:ribonuclease J
MGISEGAIKIPEIGAVFGVNKKGINKVASVPAGRSFVDGIVMTDDAEAILRTRNNLAKEGFIIVLATVRLKGGENITGPEIIARGFSTSDASIEEYKQVVTSAIKGVDFSTVEDYTEVKAVVRKTLGKYISKTSQQSPMVLPVIIEG